MRQYLFKNKWFLIVFLLILAIFFGFWYYFQHSSPRVIGGEKEYVMTVRPWLESITEKYQPSDIANVRNKLLYLNSREKSIGEAHMNLFLAFDVWQQYLATQNPEFKKQTNYFLEQAGEKMPLLEPELKRLENISAKDV